MVKKKSKVKANIVHGFCIDSLSFYCKRMCIEHSLKYNESVDQFIRPIVRRWKPESEKQILEAVFLLAPAHAEGVCKN